MLNTKLPLNKTRLYAGTRNLSYANLSPLSPNDRVESLHNVTWPTAASQAAFCEKVAVSNSKVGLLLTKHLSCQETHKVGWSAGDKRRRGVGVCKGHGEQEPEAINKPRFTRLIKNGGRKQEQWAGNVRETFRAARSWMEPEQRSHF